MTKSCNRIDNIIYYLPLVWLKARKNKDLIHSLESKVLLTKVPVSCIFPVCKKYQAVNQLHSKNDKLNHANQIREKFYRFHFILLNHLILIFRQMPILISPFILKCDALRDLVPTAQFKKREKYQG